MAVEKSLWIRAHGESVLESVLPVADGGEGGLVDDRVGSLVSGHGASWEVGYLR